MEKYAGNVLQRAYSNNVQLVSTYTRKCCMICQILRTAGNPRCKRVNRVGMFLNRAIFSHAQELLAEQQLDRSIKIMGRDAGRAFRYYESAARNFHTRPFSSVVYLTMHASLAGKNARLYCARSQTAERSRRMQSVCTWSLGDRTVRHIWQTPRYFWNFAEVARCWT